MPVRMAGGLARKLGRGATGKQKARDPRLYLTAGEHQSPDVESANSNNATAEREPATVWALSLRPIVEDEAMVTAG